MIKLRIRCLSKITGEVFYDYETRKISRLATANEILDKARSVFFNRVSSDIKEDCTFEFSLLHCCEEDCFDFKPVDVEDYNKTPVVF